MSNIGNGWYNIQPVHTTTLGLDVRGPNTTNGTNIQLYDFHGGNAQRFGFVHTGNGIYRILTAVTSGDKGIAVQNNSSADGANVYQHQFTSEYLTDYWTLEEVWTEKNAIYTSGEVPTRWSIDLGGASILASFTKSYSAEIRYKSNSEHFHLTYVENFTSIIQSEPASVVGQVLAVNARATVDGEMLTMQNCSHDEHITAPHTVYACNSFYPSIIGEVGNTTVYTYGFVNVPGPPVVGSAVCIDGSFQCIVEFLL